MLAICLSVSQVKYDHLTNAFGDNALYWVALQKSYSKVKVVLVYELYERGEQMHIDVAGHVTLICLSSCSCSCSCSFCCSSSSSMGVTTINELIIMPLFKCMLGLFVFS